MRRGSKPSFVTGENDTFIGIHLGADFCAEHEWGIDYLKQLFGMSIENTYKPFGIERRKIQDFNTEYVYFHQDGNFAILLVDSMLEYKYIQEAESLKQWLFDRSYDGLHMDDQELVTAWSDRDIGIAVQGKENVLRLERLYEAMKEKDVAIFIGGSDGIVSNAGLNMMIVSAIPKESLEIAKRTDQDAYNLVKAAEKTGIKKKIDEANNNFTGFNKPVGYYALSPKWVKDVNVKSKTKYSVVFWLNPQNQQENNFGWFTVEELEQWISGKGPIPGKNKTKSKA